MMVCADHSSGWIYNDFTLGVYTRARCGNLYIMKFFLVSTAAITLALSAPAFAQEAVNLRSGEHRGYTRLVFDWPQSVTYEMKEQGDGAFVLTFGKAGTVNPAVKGKNIQGVTVLTQDPLSVSVKVPSGAKGRTFPVNNRVVVDIYDPENPAPPPVATTPQPEEPKSATVAAAPAKTPPKPAPKPAPSVKEGSVQEVSEASVSKPDEASLQEVTQALSAIANISAEVINKDRPRAPESAPQTLAENTAEPAQSVPPSADVAGAMSTPNSAQPTSEPPQGQPIADMAQDTVQAHKFTLSSTMSVGLAAFEDFGKIWLVTDRSDLLVKPTVSGPQAEKFQPVTEQEFDGGRAYMAPSALGVNFRGEGGGLLWSVIVSPEKGDANPISLQRSGIDKSKPRSGKIVFPFQSARGILNVPDPVTGSIIKVVTVEEASDFTGASRSFVDFDLLESPVGLAIRPKVDDLDIKITPEGVEITRPGGLSILPEEMISGVEKDDFTSRMAQPTDERRIFNFADWKMGGLGALNENRNVILSGMGNMSKGSQIENLVTLAKMQLANGRGAEALGFLDFAETEMPELAQNPEFLSLRGVAKAFDWKTDEAFTDLSSPILKDYEEIEIWRGFALADLGDWQQARDVLPESIAPVRDYPSEIRNRLGIVLAEIYLRSGDLDKAKRLFTLIEKDKDTLNLAHDAALQYLKGEAARQEGNLEETKTLWTALSKGPDDLYRVKAGLSLARLQLENKEITPAQAIDALERLRYAWRGDELEAQVNYWLGRTYFESGQYIKGMNIMRDAATLVPDTILGERITADMVSLFTEFYTGATLTDASPLDAVGLYEEFTELVPPGKLGNTVISNLAEHLVEADLLDRAADMLTYQINHRLSGDEAAKTATRLAAIQLIDKNGAAALQSLQKAEGFLKALPEESQTQSRNEELALLRARALSQTDRTAEALKILEGLSPNPRVNRLRADIAWQSGFWDDAAYALEDVILDENISLTRPLSDEHAMLVLQRAVAQNLSGDRIGLANMREKYADAMSQTSKSQLFDVVTRARQNAGLADRETLLSTVSEVDLFGDFLNTYKDANPAEKSN